MSAVIVCDACGQTIAIDDYDRCSVNVSMPPPRMADLRRLLDADGRAERRRVTAEIEADTKAGAGRLATAKYQTYDLHSACFDAHLAPALAALRKGEP